MDFRSQLERISDKAHIHKWIDEQPLETEFLILACARYAERASHQFCCSDSLTICSSNWMVDVYKNYLLTVGSTL